MTNQTSIKKSGPCYIKVAASEEQDTKTNSGMKNKATERETGGLRT